MIRMWDFTEPQYQALIHLCIGVNRLLPGIKPQVPFDKKSGRHPLDRLKNYAKFAGILGHAHVQKGEKEVTCKYDPGSAFNWPRLKKALEQQAKKSWVEKPTSTYLDWIFALQFKRSIVCESFRLTFRSVWEKLDWFHKLCYKPLLCITPFSFDLQWLFPQLCSFCFRIGSPPKLGM